MGLSYAAAREERARFCSFGFYLPSHSRDVLSFDVRIFWRKERGIMVMMAESRVSGIQILGREGEASFSFGKEYAGHVVAIEEVEPRVWVVRVGDPVPENERWLFDPKVQADLDEAIAWAEKNPPQTTDLNQLEEKLFGGLPDDSGSPRSE
jgi:hypothetical protein